MATSAWTSPVTATTGRLVSAWTAPATATTVDPLLSLFIRTAGGSTQMAGWKKTPLGKTPLSTPVAPPPPVDPPPTSAAALVYPANAGAINVKNNTVANAAGDGVTDDTAAINAVLNAYDWRNEAPDTNQGLTAGAPRTVYLGPGTFLISDKVHALGSSVRIQGAGVDLTTIKLKNFAAGYGDAANPKHVLRTGYAFPYDPTDTQWNRDNSGFANYVMDLTIDVGTGNPGAIGCRFSVANVGAMERVRIKSSDPGRLGARGLSFETNPGSGLVQEVEIDGFTYGIYADALCVNDLTFVNVTLKNQLTNAVRNVGKNLTFNNLAVTNGPATAINLSGGQAAMTMIGGTLNRTGTGTAISSSGAYMHLRDVTVTGYSNIVTHAGVVRFAGATSLTEWSTHPYSVGNTTTAWTETTPRKSLGLPIEYAPRYDQTDLAQWVNVADFGATPNDDANDDAVGVRAAITSAVAAGKDTIYFPYGRYVLKSDVTVPTGIKKVDFMGSVIFTSNNSRFVAQTTGTTVFENGCMRQVAIHADTATGTVVCRHFGSLSGVGGYVTTSAACTSATRIFADNMGQWTSFIITAPANVWVRSWNRERNAGYWQISGGAKFWHLGHNIEEGINDAGPMEQVQVSGSGTRMEVLGGAYDFLSSDRWPASGIPAHDVSGGARVSIAIAGFSSGGGVVHYWLRDVNGANTYTYIDKHFTPGPTVAGRIRMVWPLYTSP